MPFYTFRCNSCNEKFEIMCSMAEKDSGSVVCPHCGANELDRIFEGVSVDVKNAGSCPAAGGGGGCCCNGGSCPHAR